MHTPLPSPTSSPVPTILFEDAAVPPLAAPSYSRLPRLAPPLGRRPEFTPPTGLLALARAQPPR